MVQISPGRCLWLDELEVHTKRVDQKVGLDGTTDGYIPCHSFVVITNC